MCFVPSNRCCDGLCSIFFYGWCIYWSKHLLFDMPNISWVRDTAYFYTWWSLFWFSNQFVLFITHRLWYLCSFSIVYALFGSIYVFLNWCSHGWVLVLFLDLWCIFRVAKCVLFPNSGLRLVLLIYLRWLMNSFGHKMFSVT